MKKVQPEMYPFFNDVKEFYEETLEFVEKYIEGYYGFQDKDDTADLDKDQELGQFYVSLLRHSGVDTKFRLKKANLVNILTSFISNQTVWCNHLSGCVSFQYLIDPNYIGLKILNNDKCKGNTIESYVEYCILSLSKGWNLINFDGSNIALKSNGYYQRNPQEMKLWTNVLLNDNNYMKNRGLFMKYFDKQRQDKDKQKPQKRVPYIGCDPKYFGCSIMI